MINLKMWFLRLRKPTMDNPPSSSELDKMAQKIAAETITLLWGTEKSYGVQALAGPLATRFLSFYIATLVYKALSIPDQSGKVNHESSRRNFANMKMKLQDAISHGFDSGVGLFCHQNVEYYCSIAPVPDMVSKTHN